MTLLDAEVPARALAVYAHPDDPEISDPMGKGCGCGVAGGNGPLSAVWFASAVVLGLLQRRRRRA